jgi:hypothetical protein
MRSMRISILTIIAMSVTLFGQDTTHYYLMSYFKNNYPPQNDMAGGFFALSTDGMNWTELNDGQPTIPGSWIGEKLMRDPSIYFDKANMMFRMVYTTGWTMKCLGYMQIPIVDGKDFKNFQDWDVLDDQNHRQIPIYVSDSIPGSICTWAPEIFWDDIQNKYMIYWSTDYGSGKRAFYVLTSDFKTFTNPVKFFDPGYTEIDGNLFKAADNLYYMFFKDERDEGRDLHYITATNPQGKDAQGNDGKGWSEISPPITTLQGVEGPSAIKIKDEYRLYFDPYATRINYRLIVSKDLTTWKDAGTVKAAGSNFYFSHCSVVEIPKYIYDWINTTKLSAVLRNDKPMAPKYVSGNCFNAPGIYNLLGKRCVSIYSWSGENALTNMPSGYFITVDKTKKAENSVKVAK